VHSGQPPPLFRIDVANVISSLANQQAQGLSVPIRFALCYWVVWHKWVVDRRLCI
jgi:hypothetical protein